MLGPELTDRPLRRKCPLAYISSIQYSSICQGVIICHAALLESCLQCWWWQTLRVRPEEQIMLVAC